ncbi:hypothetical protein [Rhodopila sp.]|uniref:hypothetical protein n=1 Tax=Rhodopila sp. TaxID=2480087 RepID=UPI003D0FFBE9
MWSEPYLETCCRSALHRLYLCDSAGRPAGQKDDPCLRRLMNGGLCAERQDGRFVVTAAGRRRHATEVLRSPVAPIDD